MNNNEYAIKVENLVKSYGDVKAVKGISFYVTKGSFFAFLGENGAGKSTTINIISTILKKDSGKVYINGLDLDKDAQKIKNEIGIVFQGSVLDQELTVMQNLTIRTSFYSLTKKERERNIKSVIDLFELKEILHRRINQLSGGQKRRVDIARAMVHSPRILILDEPTTGLDPKTRQVVWESIEKIQRETGMTIFLTTHYLEEAEKAGYVIVINHGEVVAYGLPVDLKNQYSRNYILSYGKRNPKFEKALKKNKHDYDYDAAKSAYMIYYDSRARLLSLLKTYDMYLEDFEVLKGTMDDAFINITRKQNGAKYAKNK